MNTDAIKAVEKINGEIAVLEAKIIEKQAERERLIEAATRRLNELRGPKRNVDGRRRTGPTAGTPNTAQRKLSPEQVRDIRKQVRAGATQRSMGEKYGLPQPCISSIVHRRTYQDVD